MRAGERQVAPELSGIRRDHVARYEWAAKQLKPGSRVLDLACGVGYGTRVLANRGHTVFAVDRDAEAIAYGREHYPHPRVTYQCNDASNLRYLGAGEFDAVICFETIEHLADPAPVLTEFRRIAPLLIASVPNEAVFPFRCEQNSYQGWAHHHRHYTHDEFAALLSGCGFRPRQWFGQAGPTSEVEPEVEGRTLIAVAERAEQKAVVPDHVAIVGLGPSATAYFDQVKAMGGRRAWADEIWGINALGDVLACDRIFHMDDVAVQERRAAAKPDGNIARMLDWLRIHPGPIYTSIVRPGYPGLVSFPLEDVLNNGGVPYLNNTAAYAIAYARHIGVKKISLYGVDFTRPNIHEGERGRACCEFWLGLCSASGMEIILPEQTTLMDACAPPAELLYGYDGVDVVLNDAGNGKLALEFRPKELPTAAEIEARYDHNQHPNRLMRKDAT